MAYEHLSRDELARSSLLRAQDLDKVTGAMFEALPGAFLASIAPGICFLFLALSLLFGEQGGFGWQANFGLIIGGAASAIVGWPWFARWLAAKRNARAFTREMRERTAELKRRRLAAERGGTG